ncbi:MAG: polyprenyl synthetase family protein [Candidatus Moraniibacteriota bacterium]|jgi:geranylgeranyl diphosphate synthase, type I
MDIKNELAEFKVSIDREIEIYLDRVIAESKKRDLDIFMIDAIKYYKKTILAGGKRIRPIMMCLGYRAAGGKNHSEILKTSISIELIHSFLLMHDDIIDRDDFRHGKKTIHARYRDYNKSLLNNNEPDHFGQSIAMIIGDFVYSLGNQVLFESKFDAKLIVGALNRTQQIVGLTCIGEIQDVYMEYSKKATEEDVLKMYENKTAKYTFEGPLQLGAMLAGADKEFCDSLGGYAVPIGIAFQIQDDMLGVFGDEKKTGKPVGSDIVEGKLTFMVKRAYNNATIDQKNILDEYLGNKNMTDKDIIKFQNMIIESGAKKDCDEYSKKLIKESKKALMKIKIDDYVKSFLLEIADYLNNREK